MHILIATDADWVVEEVTAALGDTETAFTVCRDGRVVARLVAERDPGLVILDLQIGSMGGMATTMSMRLDESAGALQHVPVLMLLDRPADVFLAKRSGAEGWLIKPLDALRLKRAALALLDGGTYVEGVPAEPEAEQAHDQADDQASDDEATEDDSSGAESESAEEQPATAG